MKFFSTNMHRLVDNVNQKKNSCLVTIGTDLYTFHLDPYE